MAETDLADVTSPARAAGQKCNSNMKDKRRLSNGSTKSLLEIETDVEVDLENYSSSKASKSSSRSRRR